MYKLFITLFIVLFIGTVVYYITSGNNEDLFVPVAAVSGE